MTAADLMTLTPGGTRVPYSAHDLEPGCRAFVKVLVPTGEEQPCVRVADAVSRGVLRAIRWDATRTGTARIVDWLARYGIDASLDDYDPHSPTTLGVNGPSSKYHHVYPGEWVCVDALGIPLKVQVSDFAGNFEVFPLLDLVGPRP